jgi:hypothetical protein
MTSVLVGLVFLATAAAIGMIRSRGRRRREQHTRELRAMRAYFVERLRFVVWQRDAERGLRLVITRQRDVLQAIADRRMRDVADAAGEPAVAEQLAEPPTLRAVPDAPALPARRTRTRKKAAG